MPEVLMIVWDLFLVVFILDMIGAPDEFEGTWFRATFGMRRAVDNVALFKRDFGDLDCIAELENS